RDFLQQSLSAATILSTSDPLQRIERILHGYDAQGIHRTGTAVDRRSADWLAMQVRACGAKPVLESFAHNRVDPQAAYVEVAGRRIAGLPAFDAAFTDPAGVRGRLGPAGSDAEIGLAEAPPNSEYSPAYDKLRRESKQRAFIVVTRGGKPGLTPINGGKFRAPFGPPVLQVSSEEGAWLMEQAGKDAEARLVAHVKRTGVQAVNVTAKIGGRDPKLAPIVVITPRSGWWQCTSERGGGLICWLEAMRALTGSKPARDCYFLASTGHELGHLGLEDFIHRQAELVKAAQAWIHFGANIGLPGEAGHRLQASADELEKIAVECLDRASVKISEKMPRGTVPFGEAGNIHRGGGHYVSLLGMGNLWFHHPGDRWPEAVDAKAIARCAEAMIQVTLTLAD
ncbi:MAG: hypothetical protein ACREVM_08340, partial [Burkholderiales bacterium]